jgi:predicted MFS family arabinose efflux permease
LGATDAEIGLIFSISAVGAIAGALIGGQVQKRFRFGQVIITTVWITALLFPLLAFAPTFWFLGIIMGLSWITGPIYNVVQYSYRVALIPDALQGRVNSVFRLLAFGFQPAGAAIAGILIERYSVYVAIAFFSIWYVAWAIATIFNRNVRGARQIGAASV